MRELTSARWIFLKGFLFLALGLMAGALLIVERPTVRVVLLLMVAVWSFCRFYYFAFYVIGRYVDPSYKFSGLMSFVAYWVRKRKEN